VFNRAIVAAAGVVLATAASAQTPLSFALDWRFEGPAAPYFVAIDKGHFAAAGLDVTVEAGDGSVNLTDP
jgi:NitT/TauT family transport system substrate-binding protein